MGLGLRRAFEFLVKDFAIRKDANGEEEIKKLSLGKCIEKYIEQPTAKGAAKRVAWLGNDWAHYERKWDRPRGV